MRYYVSLGAAFSFGAMTTVNSGEEPWCTVRFVVFHVASQEVPFEWLGKSTHERIFKILYFSSYCKIFDCEWVTCDSIWRQRRLSTICTSFYFRTTFMCTDNCNCNYHLSCQLGRVPPVLDTPPCAPSLPLLVFTVNRCTVTRTTFKLFFQARLIFSLLLGKDGHTSRNGGNGDSAAHKGDGTYHIQKQYSHKDSHSLIDF